MTPFQAYTVRLLKDSPIGFIELVPGALLNSLELDRVIVIALPRAPTPYELQRIRDAFTEDRS